MSDRRPDTARIPRARPKNRRQRQTVTLGGLDDHVGYLVRRFQVWIFTDFIRSLKTVDIRPGQYSVLMVIGANPGLSQSDVASSLGIERARLVRVLDGLGARGLIQRANSDRDRRSHALYLTRQGDKILQQSRELAAQHEARTARQIGRPQHRLLLKLLKDVEQL